MSDKKALVRVVKEFELNEIAEEIKAIFVESEFSAKMTIIEAYHKVGELIHQFPGDKSKILHDLAVKTGRAERSLWYSSKFYEKYPDLKKTLETLPEGKNISMNMLITKYLTTKSEKTAHVCEFVTICRICKQPMTAEAARERAS